jgi:hypothetical protein
VAGRLPAVERLKVALVERGAQAHLSELIRALAADGRGKDVIRQGRVYGGYPYYQDPEFGIPDECYDITSELAVHHHLAAMSWDGTRLRLAGYAYLEHVDTVGVSTAFVLRDRLGRVERRWPVRVVPTPGLDEPGGPDRYDYGLAGFEVELDPADVGGGTWTAFLAVGAQGVVKEVPVGGNRAESVTELAQGPVSARFSKYGTLTLAIGE